MNNQQKKGNAKLAIIFFLGTAAGNVIADTVYVDGGGVCGGNAPCYTTVQAGVIDVTTPAFVRIYPGTYNESVDLDAMNGGEVGDITLQAVNENGVAAVHTVTIFGVAGAAINSSSVFEGNVAIHGLVVRAPDDNGIYLFENDGDITITGVRANGNGEHGIRLDDFAAGNTITIRNTQANDNRDGGIDIDVFSLKDPTEVYFSYVKANNNGDDGIDINDLGTDDDGPFVLDRLNHIVEMYNITTNGNGDYDGLFVELFGAAVIMGYITSNRNTEDGVDIEDAASIWISDSTANGNGASDPNSSQDGFELEAYEFIIAERIKAFGNYASGIELESKDRDGDGDDFDDVLENAHVSCAQLIENNEGVSVDDANADSDIIISLSDFISNRTAGAIITDNSESDAVVDARGNFWGSSTGPTHPDNPGGVGDKIGDGDNIIDDSVGELSFSPFETTNASNDYLCGAEGIPALDWPGKLLMALMLLGTGLLMSQRILGSE